MAKGKRLTDKEKKKIIADYIVNQNYSETARINNISDTSVRRIIKNNQKIANIVEQKKEQNTQDILEYLEGQLSGYKSYANYMLNRLDPKQSKESLDNLTEMQLVTIFGVLTDKMLKSKEIYLKNSETGYKTAQTEQIKLQSELLEEKIKLLKGSEPDLTLQKILLEVLKDD